MNAIKPAETKDERDFEKLVIWVSTLSIAVMAGFLASIKQVNPALQFRFSIFSVLAFIAGGALTAFFLRFVLKGNKSKKGLLVVGVAIACVIGYFFIAIRHVPPDTRRDVTIGTAAAVAVLSFLGFILWRMTRFFESDQQRDRDDVG
jgi:peptidoglycan/LPS O-acetylase OafA/YrhL